MGRTCSAVLLALCAVVGSAAGQAVAPDPAVVAALVERLDDARYAVREESADALRAMGTAVVPLLARYRDDPRHEVRTRVRGLEAEVPVLAALARVAEWPTRTAAELGSPNLGERSRCVRDVIQGARPTLAFAALLEVARHMPQRGIGRAALEGLSRIAAPAMTLALARRTPEWPPSRSEHALELVMRSLDTPHVDAAVAARLAATPVGDDTRDGATLFERLVELAEELGFSFVLDAANDRIAIMSVSAAIEHWDRWLAGPGHAELLWADVLRELVGADFDALAPAAIALAVSELEGGSAVARRRAAYVLGRSAAATAELEAARRRAPPERRAIFDEPLARAHLRTVGFAQLVMRRGETGYACHQRLDGASVRSLVPAWTASLAPGGRHACVTPAHGEPFVVDQRGRPTWTAPFVEKVSWSSRWSPTGRHLLHEWETADGTRDHRLVEAETGRELTLGLDADARVQGSPQFSPDGRHIALGARDAKGVHAMVGAVGGPPLRIAIAGLSGHTSVWIDAETVLVVGRQADTGSLALYRVGSDGAVRAEMVVPPQLEESYRSIVSVSPDRRRLLSRVQSGAYALASLDEPRARDLCGTDVCVLPAWSPDGSRVACFSERLRLFDAEGREVELPPYPQEVQRCWPLWRPDGSLVTFDVDHFDRQAHGTSTARVRRLVAGGWNTVATIRGGAHWLASSPDGEWLFYLDWSFARGGIHALSLDTGMTFDVSPWLDIGDSVDFHFGR